MNNTLKKPKGILIDWGHTLMQTNFDRELGIKRLIESPFTPDNVTAEMVKAVGDELIADTEGLRYGAMLEFSRRQFDRNLFERLGINYDKDEDEIDWDFYSDYISPSLEPGVKEALAAIHKLGIRMGVVSNSVLAGKTLSRILDEFGLLKYFDFVMSSTDYGFRKPHSQLFKTALAKLKTDPQDTWFIGDSLELDIAGSQQLGIVGVWYNPDRKETEEIVPDIEVNMWEEVVELLSTVFPAKENFR